MEDKDLQKLVTKLAEALKGMRPPASNPSAGQAAIQANLFAQNKQTGQTVPLLWDEETQSFDIDRITTGITSSKRGKILLVKEILAQLESRLGKLLPIEELEKAIEDKISKAELEEAIDQLSKSGDIFRPKKGFIQKI